MVTNDAEHRTSPRPQWRRDRNALILMRLERKPSGASRRDIDDAPVDGVGSAVEFLGRVIGEHGVVGQLGGHEIRIHGRESGIQTLRNRSVQSAPNAQNPASGGVIADQGLARAGVTRSALRQKPVQFRHREYGALCEEVREHRWVFLDDDTGQ